MRGQLQRWSLAVLLGCSGGLACAERGSSAAPTPEVCDLQVTGASIQYKGNALPLPGALDAWERAFGPPSRQVQLADVSYLWDQVGIAGIGREPGSVLLDLFVLLTRPGEPDQDPPDYLPRSPFTGRLCVDGGRLSASTRIEDINRAKQGQKFSRGYLDSIYSYDVTSPVGVYVRIDLADNGRPESFSMSITEGKPRSSP